MLLSYDAPVAVRARWRRLFAITLLGVLNVADVFGRGRADVAPNEFQRHGQCTVADASQTRDTRALQTQSSASALGGTPSPRRKHSMSMTDMDFLTLHNNRHELFVDLYQIASHFADAGDVVVSESERKQVARIFWIVGSNAYETSAFDTALRYLNLAVTFARLPTGARACRSAFALC